MLMSLSLRIQAYPSNFDNEMSVMPMRSRRMQGLSRKLWLSYFERGSRSNYCILRLNQTRKFPNMQRLKVFNVSVGFSFRATNVTRRAAMQPSSQ